MDHPQPTAYCVAGRYPTVIVTTGALTPVLLALTPALVALALGRLPVA